MSSESGGEAILTDALAGTLFRPILEAADHAQLGISVNVFEDDGPRRVYVSAVAARILGYSVGELLGTSSYQSFPPEEVERFMEARKRFTRGEPVPSAFETVVIRKDGTRTPVEIAYSTVYLDGKRAMVSFLRDISARKRDEEALKKSEALFRKLIELAPEAVTVSREEHRIVYANPRFLELLGYDRLEGRATKNLELVHPDDLARIPERLAQLRTAPERGKEPREYRLLRKDGGVVSVECVSLSIEFEGAPANLTFMRDITQRKKMQAQIIQTDRMATIGTLAASVAHELNNPLAYVMLNLDLFAREIDALVTSPDDRVRVKERLRILEEGGRHMASIVRDLRSFCRPDTQPRPVDVRQVLESAINMATSEIAGRARVVRDWAPVGSVLADAARLGQVFLNLLLNAAHALVDGDPDVDQIRVVLRPRGAGEVMIEISDSGPGIAPQILDRIFEPFFTTKAVGVGTGLGLSISKSIVDSMAGQISVESQLGRGSSFRVLLPTTAPLEPSLELTDEAMEQTDTDARLGRQRLLIVDDEEAFAAALQRMLEDEHEVVAVTSAAQALELLLDGANFDVVLCDILMPGLSGIDFYRELERRRPDLSARLIFMTGAEAMPIAAEFLARVENFRIEKPVDLPRLRALIHDVDRARAGSGR
jgi:PAS domain S-box-containing protein